MADYAREPLSTRGRSHALDFRLPDGSAPLEPPRVVAVDGDPELDVQAGYVAMPGGGLGLRIMLPPATAPGVYAVTVATDGEEHVPLLAEVVPHAELVLTPSVLDLSASAGGEASGRVCARNAGNVVLDLPARRHLGLMEIDALDRSLGRTWTSEAEGVDRWGVLADELAASFAGHALLVVCAGAGQLEPGEERELEIEIHVPKDAPAARYFGDCRLVDTPLAVRLEVLAAAPATSKGER